MINATVAGNGGNRRRSRALSRENIRQDTRRGSRAGSKSNVLDIDGLDGTHRSGCRFGRKANIFETVCHDVTEPRSKTDTYLCICIFMTFIICDKMIQCQFFYTCLCYCQKCQKSKTNFTKEKVRPNKGWTV